MPIDPAWKRAKDPFSWHGKRCNLTTGKGLQVCSCKPAIYSEPYATIFADALLKGFAEHEEAKKAAHDAD